MGVRFACYVVVVVVVYLFNFALCIVCLICFSFYIYGRVSDEKYAIHLGMLDHYLPSRLRSMMLWLLDSGSLC